MTRNFSNGLPERLTSSTSKATRSPTFADSGPVTSTATGSSPRAATGKTVASMTSMTGMTGMTGMRRITERTVESGSKRTADDRDMVAVSGNGGSMKPEKATTGPDRAESRKPSHRAPGPEGRVSTSGRRPAKRLAEDRHPPVVATGCDVSRVFSRSTGAARFRPAPCRSHPRQYSSPCRRSVRCASRRN